MGHGGFQNPCSDLVNNWSILFVLDKDVIPEFQIGRVAEALDVAFIDTDGWILHIQRMQRQLVTKTDRRHETIKPFRYDLETYAGRLSKVTFYPARWHLSGFSIDTQ